MGNNVADFTNYNQFDSPTLVESFSKALIILKQSVRKSVETIPGKYYLPFRNP